MIVRVDSRPLFVFYFHTEMINSTYIVISDIRLTCVAIFFSGYLFNRDYWLVLLELIDW